LEPQLSFAETARELGKTAFIERLHSEAPLFRDPKGFWVASSFEDVRAILLDHATFSSSAMGGGAIGFPLLTDDPPRHSELRGMLAKAFTPASIEAMRPAVEELARELVARIPGDQEVDIVAALTTPLPVAVIAGMLGVPESGHTSFKRWSDAIVGIQDSPISPERIHALAELRGYFVELVERRKREPSDDLISTLLRVRGSEESLSDAQVVGFAILLMIAGNETTTNLLGNLLHRLASDPEAWSQLRERRDLVDVAVEESLRYDSPAQLVMRRARRSVELGGHTIAEGELVIVYLAAANRDPARWSHASEFEFGRAAERHVAFGHGVHTCIGAPLARLEASVAMHALVNRFASLRAGKQAPERMITSVLFGFRSLPLVFL